MSEPILMPFQNLPFNGDGYVCKEFLRLRDKYRLNTAVETGSCLYSTTKWLGENFDKVHTIEISEEFSRHGIHKVSGMKNVSAHIGDSVERLKLLSSSLDKKTRAIFFLDAHWGQNCPLLAEMDEIARMRLGTPPLVAIHDFFTGDERLGWDEYNGQRFDYAWIEPKVRALESAFGCTYAHHYNTDAENGMRGVIYLTPNISWAHEIALSEDKWWKYSQCGEEAYIEFILSKIPQRGRHIVEIGAWDGYHLSNTRYFIEQGYTALLIDGDNHGNEDVRKHFVTKENVLGILREYGTPNEFDMLCVDIDGNDIYIIDEILKEYKPSLIVAEYNPIWPEGVSRAITYDPSHVWSNDDYYGFSFEAGLRMAERNGYACVFENDGLNMYFVRRDMVEHPPKVNYRTRNDHPHSARQGWVEY